MTKEETFTLAEAIDIALLNNPGTMESWASAREAAAKYGQSLKNDFVLANVDYDFERSRSAEFTSDNREIIYETVHGVDLALSYIVLDFGQTRFTSKSALQSLYNANWTHNREIQKVIEEIMLDYYGYLYNKQLLEAAKADVDNAKVALDAVLEKRRTGVADISDQMQAVTNLSQQQLNVVTQKKALHDAYTKLITDMGVPSRFELAFESYPSEPFEVPVDTLDQLVEEAMDKRPDLIAAEANVLSKEASLKAANRKLFPVVSTSFDIGRTYYQRGLNDDYDFKFALNINYPLFQGYFLKNGVRLAEAELQKSRAQLQQIRLDVEEQVNNAREDVLLAEEAYEYAKAFLEASEEEFKVSLSKYRVGTNTIVELISALTSVADARAKFAEAEKNWYNSLANLRFALGVLSVSDSEVL